MIQTLGDILRTGQPVAIDFGVGELRCRDRKLEFGFHSTYAAARKPHPSLIRPLAACKALGLSSGASTCGTSSVPGTASSVRRSSSFGKPPVNPAAPVSSGGDTAEAEGNVHGEHQATSQAMHAPGHAPATTQGLHSLPRPAQPGTPEAAVRPLRQSSTGRLLPRPPLPNPVSRYPAARQSLEVPSGGNHTTIELTKAYSADGTYPAVPGPAASGGNSHLTKDMPSVHAHDGVDAPETSQPADVAALAEDLRNKLQPVTPDQQASSSPQRRQPPQPLLPQEATQPQLQPQPQPQAQLQLQLQLQPQIQAQAQHAPTVGSVLRASFSLPSAGHHNSVGVALGLTGAAMQRQVQVRPAGTSQEGFAAGDSAASALVPPATSSCQDVMPPGTSDSSRQREAAVLQAAIERSHHER